MLPVIFLPIVRLPVVFVLVNAIDAVEPLFVIDVLATSLFSLALFVTSITTSYTDGSYVIVLSDPETSATWYVYVPTALNVNASNVIVPSAAFPFVCVADDAPSSVNVKLNWFTVSVCAVPSIVYDTLDAAKYEKPSEGIPSTDLTSSIQTSLGLADNSVQFGELVGTVN